MTRNCKISLSTIAQAVLCMMVLHPSELAFAQDPSSKQASSSAAPAANHGYQLAPGDVLEIRFFYDPELNEKVQIRPDGHITLSLIGEVQLKSKSIAEATSELENAYKNYLKTPSITVQVEEFASQKIFVGGEIQRPGMFPLLGKMSVLDALISAGGLKPTGTSNSVILLRRRSDGTPEMLQKISLRSVKNQPPQAAQIFLQSFDVILVPQKRIAKVDRWVDQYLRQTVPLQMNAGFNYLLNGGVLIP
ncbi:MAG: polysaccharide biosynthesis/export family protein [Candidatus Acidiferrum sp.]